ncbi:hypothetical protein KEM52_002807 [Ascosphaera acerosa]|nr:hypothetical protein KEM52_002807 [Ascosphaera acerosa]
MSYGGDAFLTLKLEGGGEGGGRDKPDTSDKSDKPDERQHEARETQRDRPALDDKNGDQKTEKGDDNGKGDDNDKGDPLETMFRMPEPEPEPAQAGSSSSAEPAPQSQSLPQGREEATPDPATATDPADRPLEDTDGDTDTDTDEYVPHLDTYGLVQSLQAGGLSEAQAEALLRAVRLSLARHVGTARAAAVSRSQIENEAYLFRAASEELRASVTAARAAEVEAARARRAALQHELDILAQRLAQEFAGLKDGLKEMFHERKSETRESQRAIDSAIQELNYQITVSLGSDGKSEVEGLRWTLTRRAALAIAISAFMSIIALRFHSYTNTKRERDQKAAEVERESATAAKAEEKASPAAAADERTPVPAEVVYTEPIG